MNKILKYPHTLTLDLVGDKNFFDYLKVSFHRGRKETHPLLRKTAYQSTLNSQTYSLQPINQGHFTSMSGTEKASHRVSNSSWTLNGRTEIVCDMKLYVTRLAS